MAVTRLREGDYVAICDRCGHKAHASDLQMEWDGLFVHKRGSGHKCWEARHPQDFVRGVPDRQNVPIPRPWPADQFIQGNINPEDYP